MTIDMDEARTTFAWGGDVNLGRRQNIRTRDLGPERVLRIPALREADVRAVKLECVILMLGQQGVDMNLAQ